MFYLNLKETNEIMRNFKKSSFLNSVHLLQLEEVTRSLMKAFKNYGNFSEKVNKSFSEFCNGSKTFSVTILSQNC